MNIFANAGGRRFVAVMACGMSTTVLCLLGKVGAEMYVEAIKWTIVPFVLGNTVQHVAPFFNVQPKAKKDGGN